MRERSRRRRFRQTIRSSSAGVLGPGERLVVRFATGELVTPKTFRDERRARGDYRAIVRSWQFDLSRAQALTAPPAPSDADLVRFAFAKDEIKDVVEVVASGGGEPVFSMGDDAALPFLERRMPVAYYLRQRFAQVTNPPIDPYREGLVFDMRAWIGSGPTNGDVPSFGSLVMLDHAVLDEHAFDLVRSDERLGAARRSTRARRVTPRRAVARDRARSRRSRAPRRKSDRSRRSRRADAAFRRCSRREPSIKR